MVTPSLAGSLAPAPEDDTEAEPSLGVPEAPSTVQNCDFAKNWYEDLLEKYPAGTAVPLECNPSDGDLADLSLPSHERLASMDFDEPTMFDEEGQAHTVAKDLLRPRSMEASAQIQEPVHYRDDHDQGNNDDSSDDGDSTGSGPAVAALAGNGCVGIRPGGLILVIGGGGLAFCSLAHMYGPDTISTAGHCACNGQEITMVGLVGDNDLAPVLLDIGTVSTSHDNGVGDDYALIDIYDEHTDLATPTMCAWGGPFLGAYSNDDVLAQGTNNGGVTVNPHPTLVQGIVHYGHGTGIGTGGTPRAGVGATCSSDDFAFVGAIGPGDSGSGANTATTQAAGVITHIVVEPLMRDGVGIAAGTRADVIGTPTMGLPVGVPAPLQVPSTS